LQEQSRNDTGWQHLAPAGALSPPSLRRRGCAQPFWQATWILPHSATRSHRSGRRRARTLAVRV